MSHLPGASMSEMDQTTTTADVVAPAWSVQELEGRGRGVVSTSLIPSGSVVLLESRPLVHVAHASRALEACAHCLSLRLAEVSTKFLPQPIVCQVCAQAAWCSEECRNHSTVRGDHPIQVCLAYKRLAEKAREEKKRRDTKEEDQEEGEEDSSEEGLDAEMQSDARLLFHAYSFRRYRADDFARLNLLCSADTKPLAAAAPVATAVGASASASASASTAASSSGAASTLSALELEEERRIERLHDAVVDCLQYAAKCIAQPSPPSLPQAAVAGTAAADTVESDSALQLALPSLSKQLTDLHVSHPSDDLTSSLAGDADLPVTRALYLRVQANGFALAAPNDKLGNRQTPRGYAIYTRAAMVNHACMPCVARFDHIDQRDVKYVKAGAASAAASAAASSSSSSSGASSSYSAASSPLLPSPLAAAVSLSDCASSSAFTPLALELRAMHAIQPYTELTMSYLPLFWDRADRQQQLREEYGFKCRCERCRLEKAQERAEREKAAAAAAAGGEEDDEEEVCAHDDDDEDDDDDDEAGEDAEDDDADDAEVALSDDDADDLAAAASSAGDHALTRGELNIYCMKYICPSKICGGTMAPVRAPPTAAADSTSSSSSSSKKKVASAPVGETMVCNVCAKERTDAAFHRQLAKEFGVRR